MAFAYTGVAPPATSRPIEVIRITTQTVRTFTFLTSKPLGVVFHWHGRRSHECTIRERGECEGCACNWPSKWRAYVHAVEWDQWRTSVFIELTKDAMDQLFHQTGAREDLRGISVRLYKGKGGKHGRFIVEKYPGEQSPDELRAAEDPLPVLRRLWAVNRKASIQPNP